MELENGLPPTKLEHHLVIWNKVDSLLTGLQLTGSLLQPSGSYGGEIKDQPGNNSGSTPGDGKIYVLLF